MGAKDIATMGGMYIERSMYNLKKNVQDFMRDVPGQQPETQPKAWDGVR